MALDFGNGQGTGGNVPADEQIAPSGGESGGFTGGFASGFKAAGGSSRNNLQQSGVEMADDYNAGRVSDGRKKTPRIGSGKKAFRPANSTAANIPWRFLIIAAVVIAVVTLVIVYWDVIVAFILQVIELLIIAAAVIFGLQSMLGTGGGRRRRRW